MRIAILGLGLIGGSLAKALKHFDHHILINAYDTNEVSLAYGQKQGIIDHIFQNAAEAVKEADIVVMASPPSTFETLAKRIAPALKPGTIITDTGSVKLAAITSIAPHLPENVCFIPGHPIAGSEQSGVQAALVDLFQKRRVLLTPHTELPRKQIMPIIEMWQAAGAKVEILPAEAHDLIYAYVSHLPQLLAFAARETVETFLPQAIVPEETQDPFRRFLRLSHSNTDLWQDIFASNATNLADAQTHYLNVLDAFIAELQTAEEPPLPTDWELVATQLFPRIATTCLVATVMQVTAATDMPIARYSGTGFADFVAPSESEPEADMELISQHHLAVVQMLQDYRNRIVTA